MSALAQQQQMHVQSFVPPQAQKQISLFIGSISGGITDNFLNDLLCVSVSYHYSLLDLLKWQCRHAEKSGRSSD